MRRSLVTRRLALAVSYAIGLTLAACSGSDRHDPTGPDPEPIPDPAPTRRISRIAVQLCSDEPKDESCTKDGAFAGR